MTKKNLFVTVLGIIVLLGILVFLGWFLNKNKPSAASANITPQIARQVAETWLSQNPAPMVKHPGNQTWHTTSVRPFKDQQNVTIAYIVDLNPQGYIVVPANEAIDPILAFGTSSNFKGSQDLENDTLSDLLIRDIPSRIKNKNKTASEYKTNISRKWGKLKKGEASYTVIGSSLEMAMTPVVDKLLQTTWNQGNPGGPYTYNYYTPNHYYTGCVATAAAQVIRFFQYPSSASGTNQIHVSGESAYRTVSFNSTYNYTLMPSSIGGSSPVAQIQEIGKLMYDVGVAFGMLYGPNGSGASTANAPNVYKNFFKFSSASWKYSSYSDWPTVLKSELNAGYPSQMSIQSTSGSGHSVVADGWGNDGVNDYYHINMGWGGSYDSWYTLPKFTAGYTWDQLNGFTYNVRKPGTSDTVAPTISITSPTTGQTLTGVANVIANASDNVGVTKVEFYRDGVLVDTETNSTGGWYYAWNTALVPNASYTLTAKAYDAAGNVGNSNSVTVTTNNVVTPDTTPPVVAINSPANGSTVKTSVKINIAATDNVAVTKVEVYIDGVLSKTLTASPYTYNWNTKKAPAGTHTIQVKAYDAAGNIGIVTITVTK